MTPDMAAASAMGMARSFTVNPTGSLRDENVRARLTVARRTIRMRTLRVRTSPTGCPSPPMPCRALPKQGVHRPSLCRPHRHGQIPQTSRGASQMRNDNVPDSDGDLPDSQTKAVSALDEAKSLLALVEEELRRRVRARESLTGFPGPG